MVSKSNEKPDVISTAEFVEQGFAAKVAAGECVVFAKNESEPVRNISFDELRSKHVVWYKDDETGFTRPNEKFIVTWLPQPETTQATEAREARNVVEMWCGNKTVSLIPCNKCGGEVIEFSMPNDIWNMVIRLDGHEHDQEYLCLSCFFVALRNKLADVTRLEAALAASRKREAALREFLKRVQSHSADYMQMIEDADNQNEVYMALQTGARWLRNLGLEAAALAGESEAKADSVIYSGDATLIRTLKSEELGQTRVEFVVTGLLDLPARDYIAIVPERDTFHVTITRK